MVVGNEEIDLREKNGFLGRIIGTPDRLPQT